MKLILSTDSVVLDECGMKDNVVWTKQATQRMIRLHGQLCLCVWVFFGSVCVVLLLCVLCCCRAQRRTKSHTNASRVSSSFPFSVSWNVECRIIQHGLSRNMDKGSCFMFKVWDNRSQIPKTDQTQQRQVSERQMRLLLMDTADCRYDDKVCFDYITHVLGIHGFTETVHHSFSPLFIHRLLD